MAHGRSMPRHPCYPCFAESVIVLHRIDCIVCAGQFTNSVERSRARHVIMLIELSTLAFPPGANDRATIAFLIEPRAAWPATVKHLLRCNAENDQTLRIP